ncbi:MAG TPA: HPr family phosphocarrier protein [Candidatus Eisenbacteria bacterium]|nr:HPr family phosphocarrier protein [Candidatus Eisenbacteria bacterium]
MGTWSTSSPYTQLDERFKFIRPIYAIIVKGNLAMGIQEYYEIPTMQVLANGLPNTQIMERFGVNPMVLQRLAMANQPFVNILDGKATSLELGGGYRLLTTNNEDFERFMLMQDAKLQQNSGTMAVQYNAMGVVQRVFEYRTKKDVDDLRNLRKAAKVKGTATAFYVKDAGKQTFIEVNQTRRILAIQVSPDLRTRNRVFWSNVPADVEELARLGGIPANKNKNTFGYQIQEPANAKANNNWIINASYGYEVDDQGKLTVYDTVLKMRDRLRARQPDGSEHAYRFQYVLMDGTVVPWYQVRQSDIVVEIRDPETKSRIYTGSEYLRVNYELKMMPMVEKANRFGRRPVEHFFSKTIAADFARWGITLQSFNPYDAARGRASMEQFRYNLGQQQRAIELNDDIPAVVKKRLIIQLENLANFVSETGMVINNGQMLIVEPSTVEMAAWREQKLDALKRQQNYEAVLAAGGIIVSTNGNSFNIHSQLMQLNMEWGGDRQAVGLPDWVGANPAEQKLFQKTLLQMMRDEEKSMAKFRPQTLFVVQDPAAAAPVVEASQAEYKTYIADMQKLLVAKRADYKAAVAAVPAAAGKARNEALVEVYQLGIQIEILQRRIADTESPDDVTLKRRNVYVRDGAGADELKLIGPNPNKTVQVVIVPTPASAEVELAKARALYDQNVKNAKEHALALDRGGLVVSVPANPVMSRIFVRDPVVAKNPPQIAQWEAVIGQKAVELDRLRDTWVQKMRAGEPRGAVEAEIVSREKEFADNTFRYVDAAGTFGPKGTLYVVEFLGGAGEARTEVARNQALVKTAALAGPSQLTGAVIRIRAGVADLSVDPAVVGPAQTKLAERLKEARTEYEKLRADQKTNPTQPADPFNHARRVRDARILELADQIKSGNRYTEGGDTVLVFGGFRGAERELNQFIRRTVSANEEVYFQRDPLGVQTGVAVVWFWDGGEWKRDRIYEPLPVDNLGRSRVKVTDLRSGRVYIDTFDIISVTVGGSAYRETRPLERNTLISTSVIPVPGAADRVVENWTRTVHQAYLPNTAIPSRSVTTAYTKEGDAIREGGMVSERTIRMAKGAPQTVNGSTVYDVRFGPAAGELNNQKRMVANDTVTGEEQITFYPTDGGLTGEAIVRIGPGMFEVRTYLDDKAKGEIVLGNVVGGVHDTGKTLNGGRVYVRVDRFGRFDRAYATDPNGGESASFYLRPQTVNAVPVHGIVVIQGNQTAAILEKRVRDARGYEDDLPVNQTFFFDNQYRPLDRNGAPLEAGKAAPAVGYAVQTKNTFSSFPKEFFPISPTGWRILEEIAPNGAFVRARAVDSQGKERATISQLPDGRYMAEFISDNPTAMTLKGLPIRVTYVAEKSNGVYSLGERAISTTYKYEAPYQVPADADWIVDGNGALPPIVRDLANQIPANQKAEAKTYLHESLTELRRSMAVNGPLTLVVTAVRMENGGTSYTVRVKEDPFARIVLFFSSDRESNVMINTRWNQENATNGYELSKGLVFRIQADPIPVAMTQLVGERALSPALEKQFKGNKMTQMRLPASVVQELRDNGVPVRDDVRLSRITRYLKANGTEFAMDARYVDIDDPLVRTLAVEGSGFVRFIKWQAKDIHAPFGVSPGEIVVDVSRDPNRVIRNTRFREHQQAKGEYVYEVIPSDRAAEQRNPGIVVYNYQTHTVYEVYGVRYNAEGKQYATNTPYPYVQTSRDGIFLNVYNFTGTDYDRRSPTATIYSEFSTRTWVDHKGEYGKKGDIYILISEHILSPEVRGQGASAYLIRNGELVASITSKGQAGISAIHVMNPQNPDDLTLTQMLYDKFYNGVPGWVAGRVGAIDRDKVENLFNQIEKEGTALPVERENDRPQRVSRDYLIWTMNNAWWMGGAALLLMTLFPLYRRLRRSPEAESPEANDAADANRNIFGARLATADPGQRLVMAKELGTGLVLGPHIPEAEREALIRNHYGNVLGFSNDEVDRLVYADQYSRSWRGKLVGFLSSTLHLKRPLQAVGVRIPTYPFDDLERDPHLYPTAPRLTAANAAVDVRMARAKNKYPQALILYDLIDATGGPRLISDAELQSAVTAASDGGRRQGDLLWRWVTKILIEKAQDKVLTAAILRPGMSDAAKKRWVDALPVTPEANTLRYLLDSGILTMAQITALAAGYTSLTTFVEALVSRRFIEPRMTAVMTASYAGQVSPAVQADILQSAQAELLPYLMKNPTLLSQAATGDIVYNPNPINRAVEPVSLNEFILLKLVQRPPSQTGNHSIGQFAAMWPFSMYVVRQANAAIAAGRTPAEVLQTVDDLNGAFGPIVKREFDRYKLVTGRDQWSTAEEMVLTNIDRILRNGALTRAQVLDGVRGALLGRNRRDVLVAQVDAALTAGRSVEDILDVIRRDLDRIQLLDLFIDLDIWDLFESVQIEAEKARRDGRPALTVEQQIAATVGGGVRTPAQLRAIATGADDNEKNNIAAAYKRTTLRLAGIDHPEATAADLSTKRPASVRRIPLLLGLVTAAAGVAIGVFVGGLVVPTLVVAAGLGLLIFAFRPAGIGLRALYGGRLLKPLFSLGKFWGMGTGQKIGFLVTAGLTVAAGAAIILMAPKLLAVGILVILVAPLLLPILWSSMPWNEKFFWGGVIMGASTVYVGGLLVFFLFSGVTVVGAFTLGFLFTVILLALTYPVTVISFYHLAVSLRSYFALNGELWSDTARSLIGWRSLNPFRGLLGAMFSSRVPTSELFSHFMKLAVPLYLLGALGVIFAVIPVGFTLFTVLFVIGGLAVYLVFRSLPRGDLPEFWEGKFGEWLSELRDVEENHRSPIPNGESVAEYLERLVGILERRYLLSQDEAQQWRDALRGSPDGRLVRPRSAKALDLLQMTFFTLSQKKVVPDVWALLQASSTHVQAAGEMFGHTLENCIVLGTFNEIPAVPSDPPGADRRTSLAGYVARTNPAEWENLVGIDSALAHNPSANVRRATVLLRNVNERTNIVELLTTAGLTVSEREVVYRAILGWMNEMRPNNDAVMDSMAQDYVEYHLLAAFETGNLAYQAAVREIAASNTSLAEAHRTLSALPRASLSPGQLVFVDNYARYQAKIDLKLRPIFQDALLWGNFRGSAGGVNLTDVRPLQVAGPPAADTGLIKILTDYANRLPADDPMRRSLLGGPAGLMGPAVTGLINELNEFNPQFVPVTDAARRAKFASMAAWSEAFLAWKEANNERLVRMVELLGRGPDATLVNAADVRERLNTLTQSALTYRKAGQNNVRVAFHNFAADNFLNNYPGKHQGIALNLAEFYGTTVDYDAHVMNEHGQHVFRSTWASMNSRQRQPNLAAINPMMKIWASTSDSFPATKIYAIAQMVWTTDVQRALRGKLLDYGKYMGIPQTIGPFSPPGEDSEGLLMLQRSANRYGVFYTGTQIDWFTYRWGRPSLLAESLVTTEMRYSFNVTRFMMDRGSFAVFYNPNVPASVKLTHIFLWFHYFIAPFALTLLILLPVLSPFSAFAFLKPFFFFVGSSFILMEAINTNNFTRHWRESGSFWQAFYLAGKDLITALPFYVFLIPFFFRGVMLASKEMFSFLRTVKEAFLRSWDDEQRFDELMIFRGIPFFGARGIPLNSLVGFAGVLSWMIAFVMMTPFGPAILLPYLLTSFAFLSGMYSFSAFRDRDGLMSGFRYSPLFVLGKSFFVIRRTFGYVFSTQSGRDRQQRAARARATAGGLQTPELGAVTPANVETLVAARSQALTRADHAGNALGLGPFARPDFRPQTTRQINEWSASSEIRHQIDTGVRVAAARLASAPEAPRSSIVSRAIEEVVARETRAPSRGLVEGARLAPWVDYFTPLLKRSTLVTRQFEQGMDLELIKRIREKSLPRPEPRGVFAPFVRLYRAITRFVTQTTLTGGLGALMFDLVNAWKKNGIDAISINPIYDTIKGQPFIRPEDLPEEVRSGRKSLGDYTREALGKPDPELSFTIRLNIGDDFRAKAKGKSREIVDREIRVQVYRTETPFGTPIYYIDAHFVAEGPQGQVLRPVFDEVYPDADGGNDYSYLWRDVHMGVYALASQTLVKRLQEKKAIKDEVVFVDNEVFVSMPTPLFPDSVRLHINHTVFRPGLYQPDAASFEMLGYPEYQRPYVVQGGKINVVDAVAMDANVLTGVGIYEHLPVLARDILAAHVNKLKGWNQDGMRSTNGALVEHWRAAERRQILSYYKKKLGLPVEAWEDEATDAALAAAFKDPVNAALKDEFTRRSEFVSASYVAQFLVWMRDEQKNGRWLDSTMAGVADAEAVLAEFRKAVAEASASGDDARWADIEARFGQVRDRLLAQPIVSNVRRQVSYKGPDKWIELLEHLKAHPSELEAFRREAGRVVIGGRIFGSEALAMFGRIKGLVEELGLQDQITTIENYNVDEAPVIFQAMAGTVMLSDEFLEASATSMMKAALNFAKYIGVWGGAMPEIFTIHEADPAAPDGLGPVINVFTHNDGKPVTHDQLRQKLNSGEWVMPNGELVEYNDSEKSRERGGGRRPSSVAGRGLLQALKGLKRDYSAPETRRATQYAVWASSYKVDMERSQARAHARLLEEAIAQRNGEKALFASLNPTTVPARQKQTEDLQKVFFNENGFHWANPADPQGRALLESGQERPGFLGFVDSIRWLRTKGYNAYASVEYHANNTTASPDGDIFHFIRQNLLKDGGESLKPFAEEIERLAAEARGADAERKVQLNFMALELVDKLAAQLAWQLLLRYKEGDGDTRESLEEYMHDIRMRENLIRYLDKNTTPLQTTSSNLKAYAAVIDGERMIVSVNWREFIYKSVSATKARATLYPEGVRAVLGPEAFEGTGKPQIYAAYNVISGRTYPPHTLQKLARKGLPLGVTHFQVLRMVPQAADGEFQRVSEIDRDDATRFVEAAINEEFIDGRELPTALLGRRIREIRNSANPAQGFRNFLRQLVRLKPEEAAERFGEAVPAVMALITALYPDYLSVIEDWNPEVFARLNALKPVIGGADFHVHQSQPQTAIVLSKTLAGGRHVTIPFHFANHPVHIDGKAWLAVTDLESLGVRDDFNSRYKVDDFYPDSTHFQVLEIRPAHYAPLSESRRTYDREHPGSHLIKGDPYQQLPPGWHIGVPVSVPAGARLSQTVQTAAWADDADDLWAVVPREADRAKRIPEVTLDLHTRQIVFKTQIRILKSAVKDVEIFRTVSPFYLHYGIEGRDWAFRQAKVDDITDNGTEYVFSVSAGFVPYEAGTQTYQGTFVTTRHIDPSHQGPQWFGGHQIRWQAGEKENGALAATRTTGAQVPAVFDAIERDLDVSNHELLRGVTQADVKEIAQALRDFVDRPTPVVPANAPIFMQKARAYQLLSDIYDQDGREGVLGIPRGWELPIPYYPQEKSLTGANQQKLSEFYWQKVMASLLQYMEAKLAPYAERLYRPIEMEGQGTSKVYEFSTSFRLDLLHILASDLVSRAGSATHPQKVLNFQANLLTGGKRAPAGQKPQPSKARPAYELKISVRESESGGGRVSYKGTYKKFTEQPDGSVREETTAEYTHVYDAESVAELGPDEDPQAKYFLDALRATGFIPDGARNPQNYLKDKQLDMTVELVTNIPPRTGLGGSVMLASFFINGLLRVSGRSEGLTKEELALLGSFLEVRLKSLGGWQDAITWPGLHLLSTIDGDIGTLADQIEKDATLKEREAEILSNIQKHTVLVVTERHEAKDVLGQLIRGYLRRDENYMKNLREGESDVQAAESWLQGLKDGHGGDIRELFRLAERQAAQFNDVVEGFITPEMKTITERLKAKDLIVASKPAGAGHGGVLMLYLKNPSAESRQAVEAEIAQFRSELMARPGKTPGANDYQILDFTPFEQKGVKVGLHESSYYQQVKGARLAAETPSAAAPVVVPSRPSLLERAVRFFGRTFGGFLRPAVLAITLLSFSVLPPSINPFLNQAVAQNVLEDKEGVIRTLKTPKDAVTFIETQSFNRKGRFEYGLPATFHVPAVSGIKFENKDHELIIRRGSGLYDTALAVLILTEQGEQKSAQRILDIYASGRYGDFQLGAYPSRDNKGAFEPFDADVHYIFNFTDATGRWTKEWSFWNVHTGPNAWLAMAASRYIEKYGGVDAPENRAYVALVNKLGKAMLRLQTTEGGVRYGPRSQYNPAAGKNDDTAYYYLNSENNVSAYAAFRTLFNLTKDKAYSDAADKILRFLSEQEVWVQTEGGEWKSQKGMLNPADGTLYMGVFWNQARKRLEIENQFATDSGGTWTLLSLGVEKIDELFGKGASFRMWKSIREKAGRTADYRPAGLKLPLAGLDYTNQIKGRVIDETSALIPPEWNAAIARRGKDAERETDTVLTLMIDRYLNHPTESVTADDIEGLRKDLASVRTRLYTRPNPYAAGPGLGGWRKAEGTGFGWIPPLDERVTAMASMYVFFERDPLAYWRGGDARLDINKPAPKAKPEEKKEPAEKKEPEAKKAEEKPPVVVEETKAEVEKALPVGAAKTSAVVYVIAAVGILGGGTAVYVLLKRHRDAKLEAAETARRSEELNRKVKTPLTSAQEAFKEAVALLPQKKEKDRSVVDLSVEALKGLDSAKRDQIRPLLTRTLLQTAAVITGIASLDQETQGEVAEDLRKARALNDKATRIRQALAQGARLAEERRETALNNPNGLHMGPAGRLVKIAAELRKGGAELSIENVGTGERVGADNTFTVLMLAMEDKTPVAAVVTGDLDAAKLGNAADVVKAYLEDTDAQEDDAKLAPYLVRARDAVAGARLAILNEGGATVTQILPVLLNFTRDFARQLSEVEAASGSARRVIADIDTINRTVNFRRDLTQQLIMRTSETREIAGVIQQLELAGPHVPEELQREYRRALQYASFAQLILNLRLVDYRLEHARLELGDQGPRHREYLRRYLERFQQRANDEIGSFATLLAVYSDSLQEGVPFALPATYRRNLGATIRELRRATEMNRVTSNIGIAPDWLREDLGAIRTSLGIAYRSLRHLPVQPDIATPVSDATAAVRSRAEAAIAQPRGALRFSTFDEFAELREALRYDAELWQEVPVIVTRVEGILNTLEARQTAWNQGNRTRDNLPVEANYLVEFAATGLVRDRFTPDGFVAFRTTAVNPQTAAVRPETQAAFAAAVQAAAAGFPSLRRGHVRTFANHLAEAYAAVQNLVPAQPGVGPDYLIDGLSIRDRGAQVATRRDMLRRVVTRVTTTHPGEAPQAVAALLGLAQTPQERPALRIFAIEAVRDIGAAVQLDPSATQPLVTILNGATDLGVPSNQTADDIRLAAIDAIAGIQSDRVLYFARLSNGLENNQRPLVMRRAAERLTSLAADAVPAESDLWTDVVRGFIGVIAFEGQRVHADTRDAVAELLSTVLAALPRQSVTLPVATTRRARRVIRERADGARLATEVRGGGPSFDVTSSTLLQEPIVLALVSNPAELGEKSRRIAEALKDTRIAARLETDFKFVAVTGAEAFAASASAPVNLLVDESAVNAPDVLEARLADALRLREEKAAEARAVAGEITGRLLETIAFVFENEKGTLDELKLASVAELRRQLAGIALPAAQAVRLEITADGELRALSGAAVISAARPVLIAGQADLGDFEKRFDAALEAPTDAETRVQLIRAGAAANDYLVADNGLELAQKLENLSAAFAAAKQRILERTERALRLDPADLPLENLAGTTVVATHESMLSWDYVRQLNEVNSRIEEMNRRTGQQLAVVNQLVVTNPAFDPALASEETLKRKYIEGDEAAGLPAHPEAAAFPGRLVFRPNLSDLSQLAKADGIYRNPWIMVAREGTDLKLGETGEQERKPLLLQLNAGAKSANGMPYVAVRLRLSDGKTTGVPGLENLGNGIFRWLPPLQKLVDLIKQAAFAIKAVGSAA